MPRAAKMRIKRVSGQEPYREQGPRLLSREGWGGKHFFSVQRITDQDFDEQVYWCISGTFETVCLNEHEAVALRPLLPTEVVGGHIETVEMDWPEPKTTPRR